MSRNQKKSVSATLLQRPVIGPIVAKLTNFDMFSYSLRKIFSVRRPSNTLMFINIHKSFPPPRLQTQKQKKKKKKKKKKVPPTEEEMKEFWASLRFNEGDLLGHKLIHYIADCTRHRERWVAAFQVTFFSLLF